MARYVAYKRSSLTMEELRGKILSIPPIESLKWFVPPNATVHLSKVPLVSLPNGTPSIAYFNTLVLWIEREELVMEEVTPEQEGIVALALLRSGLGETACVR